LIAARDDDADGNGAVRVQPLEIFEIAIVKRIFVVPFDFERDARAVGECADMIDFVRLALPGNVVDALFDDEGRLRPISVGQRAPQSLRSLSLSAAAGDDFLDRNSRLHQRRFELDSGVGKVRG
jgi:hypothetical protein